MGESDWSGLGKGLLSGAVAHSKSRAKGSGPGAARPRRPLGSDVVKGAVLLGTAASRLAQGVASGFNNASGSPHPESPSGRHFPWQIKLPGPEEGDGSFQFSATCSGGLTAKESALLDQAHTYFGLKMGADGKIAGVLILPDGTLHAFVSGKHGGPDGGSQDGFLPRGKGSGVNRFNVTHIEGHSAAVLHRAAAETMKREKVAEAALLIPKEPCGACDPNIPKMLPSGTRLFVVDPESTTVYRSDSGFSLEGKTFSRPAKLHLTIPKGTLRLKAIGKYAGRSLGMAALGIAGGWLRGKLDEHIIERQIEDMAPDIEKALQEKVDQVLELLGRKQKAYANVTVEIITITTLEPEAGGPIHFTTLPAVKLKSVAVSNQEIDPPKAEEQRDVTPGLMTTNTTLFTFSFEVGF